MIVGIGTDIIEVERVAKKIDKETGFREKVFSVQEINYCESQGANRAQHYAARFAAKEAFLKATGLGLQLTHQLHEIETISNGKKPEMQLTGSLAQLKIDNRWHKIHVSISHINAMACAVVIIESTEMPL